MPHANNAGVEIRYEVDAPDAGDPDEAVVFCGDVGARRGSSAGNTPRSRAPHTVITPETRGVGRSDAPPGPYTVEALARATWTRCVPRGIRNAHLVGYGLGGMVALAYALASSRPASLSVIGTPPAGDDYNNPPACGPTRRTRRRSRAP